MAHKLSPQRNSCTNSKQLFFARSLKVGQVYAQSPVIQLISVDFSNGQSERGKMTGRWNSVDNP